MDAQELGQSAGSYLARTVQEWTSRNVFALQFGYGMPRICPFTLEKHRPHLSEKVEALHQALVRLQLHHDHRFMAILAEAIQDIARLPVEVLVGDLANEEAHGDGGPGFHITGDRGEALSAAAMLNSFTSADRSELGKRCSPDGQEMLRGKPLAAAADISH